MRYLNKRDEFLRSYNSIVDIKESYISSNKGEVLITEDSGPFANDIGWGDSLIGRLINSTIRKAKIGANLVRIKSVEQRLRDAMDDILLTSTVAELDENDKKLYARTLITTYLLALQEGVENGDPLEELKSLTEAAITAVDLNNDLEGRNELLRQLNEWMKFLNEFKEEEEGEGQNEGQTAMESTTAYLGNFKYLFNILLIYQGIELEKVEYNRQKSNSTGSATGATAGATASTTTNGVINPANATSNISVGRVNASKSLLGYAEFKKINEGITKTVGKAVGKIWKFFTGGKDERLLDKETEKLWNAIKPLYQLFSAEKGVLVKDGELHKFLKLTPEQIEVDPKLKLLYNKYKSNIDKIYKTVRSSNGISEGVHELLGKSEQMGKYITGIYSVTKAKPDGNFMQYPGVIPEVWDELVDNIKGFNKYMKNVFEVKSKWNVGDTVAWKSSKTGSTITKDILRIDGKKLVFKDKKGQEYTKFMSEVEKVSESMMFEDVDPTDTNDDDSTVSPEKSTEDGEVRGWKNPNSVARIQDWWGKNMDLKKWVVEKTEVEKIRVNLEKKLAEKKDSIVIDGMDPVLEIVKVFNRAYKLHTTQVIPTGQSGGRVSNKTFLEYHCFGNGSPATAGASGGPYRNKAIFDQWEECVNNVKRDKKYQRIFNVGTRLKVGNDYIEKAGMNLRKFMTDMLDGDELYKSSDNKQGAQAKFLDKYFGYKAEPDGKDTFYGDDKSEVNSVANGIEPLRLVTMDGNSAVEYQNIDELKNSFFSLKLRDDKNPRYFYIQDIKDGIAYLAYSETSFHLINYIKKSKGGITIKSDFSIQNEKKEGKSYPILATTIALNKLYKNDGSLNLRGSIKISSISKEKKTDRATNIEIIDNSLGNKNYETDVKSYTIEKAMHIVDEKSKRVKTSDASAKEVMKAHGGYENITTIPNIKDAKIDIV